MIRYPDGNGNRNLYHVVNSDPSRLGGEIPQAQQTTQILGQSELELKSLLGTTSKTLTLNVCQRLSKTSVLITPLY